jgi:hypothetical protein
MAGLERLTSEVWAYKVIEQRIEQRIAIVGSAMLSFLESCRWRYLADHLIARSAFVRGSQINYLLVSIWCSEIFYCLLNVKQTYRTASTRRL